MYLDLPRPTIFAHRGASAYAPENTLAAFNLAIRQGCDAIELDAKLSADSVVMVIHDPTLDRTTNGTGKVSQLPLIALKELDAGSFFDHEFMQESIPTLEDVFESVGSQTFINVELTNYENLHDELPERVARLVSRHRLQNRVLFSSFNPIALRRIKKLIPSAPAGLLAQPGGAGRWARSRFAHFLVPYDAIHPDYHDVDMKFTRRFHQNNYRVHVYTVNDAAIMSSLFAIGVDGIFTDDPILARTVLESTNPQKSLAED